MNIIPSNQYIVISLSGQTIESLSTYSVLPVSTSTYPNQSLEMSNDSKSTSDVYYIANDQSFLTITEGTYNEINLDVSCSTSGTTLITYSIAPNNNNGDSAPSWVSVSSLGVLKFTAPFVNANTSYIIVVEAKVPNADLSIEMQVTLQVNKWLVNGCKLCKSGNTSVCTLCNSGYTLFGNICESNEVSQKIQTLGIVMKVSISMSLALILFSSMINISSIASAWMIIGQMQLMFFLILTRANIPKDIIDFITVNAEKSWTFPTKKSLTSIQKYWRHYL